MWRFQFQNDICLPYIHNHCTILFILYIPLRKIFHSQICEDLASKDNSESKTGVPHILFLITLAVIISIGGSINFVYGNLLYTFGIHSSIDASPQIMAFMTSSFFVTTIFGRILGTCLSLVVSQLVLTVVCMIGSVGASIALIFVAEMSVLSLWLGTSVLAFIFSPLFGAVIAWSSNVCQNKNILYGLIIVADICGFGLLSFSLYSADE